MNVLLAYSSRFGHTLRILNRVGHVLEGAGHTVELRPTTAIKHVPSSFDAVIVGASVRYGFFARSVWKLAKEMAAAKSMPTAFIGVNLAAAKPGKDQPGTNVYARRFLTQTSWKPTKVKLLGGELDFRLYNKMDTAMLKPILKKSGKPFGPDVHIDYTDWDAVDAFARDFSRLLKPVEE